MDKDKLAKSIFNFFMKEDCVELNGRFSQYASDGPSGDVKEEDLLEDCNFLAEQFIREQSPSGS